MIETAQLCTAMCNRTSTCTCWKIPVPGIHSRADFANHSQLHVSELRSGFVEGLLQLSSGSSVSALITVMRRS